MEEKMKNQKILENFPFLKEIKLQEEMNFEGEIDISPKINEGFPFRMDYFVRNGKIIEPPDEIEEGDYIVVVVPQQVKISGRKFIGKTIHLFCPNPFN
ncbi:hypothetical protein K9L04_00670 [Patescibacteria group bacterium]|nr:hypothetical protein [Patescibacteria group bacterium]